MGIGESLNWPETTPATTDPTKPELSQKPADNTGLIIAVVAAVVIIPGVVAVVLAKKK